MATARGATLLGPDKLEIREYPIPDIPPDGGLLKIEMGGVAAKPFDPRQDFVTENNRIGNLQLAMQVFDVRATNATHFDL